MYLLLLYKNTEYIFIFDVIRIQNIYYMPAHILKNMLNNYLILIINYYIHVLMVLMQQNFNIMIIVRIY